MNAIMDALNNWFVIGGLVLALIALIGIMLYLRKKGDEDDDE